MAVKRLLPACHCSVHLFIYFKTESFYKANFEYEENFERFCATNQSTTFQKLVGLLINNALGKLRNSDLQ